MRVWETNKSKCRQISHFAKDWIGNNVKMRRSHQITDVPYSSALKKLKTKLLCFCEDETPKSIF